LIEIKVVAIADELDNSKQVVEFREVLNGIGLASGCLDLDGLEHGAPNRNQIVP